VNFLQRYRDLLAVHREVGRLMFAAMTPGLTVKEIKRIKQQERRVRDQRKKLARLARMECRLRVDAWKHGRRYSSLR
jgi:hypothetical protein